MVAFKHSLLSLLTLFTTAQLCAMEAGPAAGPAKPSKHFPTLKRLVTEVIQSQGPIPYLKFVGYIRGNNLSAVKVLREEIMTEMNSDATPGRYMYRFPKPGGGALGYAAICAAQSGRFEILRYLLSTANIRYREQEQALYDLKRAKRDNMPYYYDALHMILNAARTDVGTDPFSEYFTTDVDLSFGIWPSLIHGDLKNARFCMTVSPTFIRSVENVKSTITTGILASIACYVGYKFIQSRLKKS